MKVIFPIFLLLVGFWCGQAHAECVEPADKSFSAMATALFNCPSNLPVMDADGERKFQNHYDFPTSPPDATALPWLPIDPLHNQSEYMMAILHYATKVNARDDIDWRIEDNKAEHWCNAPWFHMLREPLHGMTSERVSRPYELHERQTIKAKTWAVGIYNDIACYGLGQIWGDPTSPKTRGFAFHDGAIGVKMLFTTATPSQVPYLTGSKEWRVAAGDNGAVITMRLLQVDISIKDKRAPNGWFFGTFMYDAAQPGDTAYERLIPVGLIWGSDARLTANAYLTGAAVAKESWINPIAAAHFYALPRHTLGLFGRANGPLDNPMSACITCHQRALDWGRAVLPGSPEEKEAGALLPDAPSDPFDETAAKRYFRDIGSNSAVPGTQSLDYTLQVSKGVAAFRAWAILAFPDYTGSTSDVTPFPFRSAGARTEPTLPDYSSYDKFSIGTADLSNNLFRR